MTIFFNLSNLEKEAGKDSKRFITLLYNLAYNKLPRVRFKQPKLNLVGNSYILNIDPIFKNIDKQELSYTIQYIKLAGKRDYTLYKYYDLKTLQRSYYPDLFLDNIVSNPLLKITDSEIFFVYEEQ
jgi:hypothetical protein